ncbi:MAG: 4-hydroxy-3-methylbut-2-enyl diphosphate reductase [Candidatus Saccharicenans sp.]|jgi:4-hydroxy-3-methylbut-2-enyl diphosphate reductase|nr:4-hydroxy-3-methylbut-2-enyl diphosphate reductase [Candidatus Saccharicenans sp.]
MEIIIARNSGFCYGVKRALRLTSETAKKNQSRIFTWGELIHNPEVISDLKKRGIKITTSLSRLKPGDTVIIRSHGISPAVYRALQKKKINLVDATCPKVKDIQKKVEQLSRAKSEIIIVGNRHHPEIQGLLGYGQHQAVVVENEEQAKALPFKKKRAVLAQSTQDMQLFGKIVAILTEKTEELSVYNTICQSTRVRQEATAELASQVEALIIVGGKNSSNTNRLYEISRRKQIRTYFIESPEELTPDMTREAKIIGISGGASTPPEVIRKTVLAINNSCQQN